MTFQDLQKQALQLSSRDKWQLVRVLLDSLEGETPPVQRGNLSQLRGIARSSAAAADGSPEDAYLDYLTQKYQ